MQIIVRFLIDSAYFRP